MSLERLHIERLGSRGEGVARAAGGLVFVPYALAGETVLADVEKDHARLAEILEPSPDRVAPICKYYGECGGCAVQTLAPPAYAEWKRGLVDAALRNAGLEAKVAPLIDAHGAGRRRAAFHARTENETARAGFMQARSHEIVEIESCPLFAPELAGALPAARAIAQALARRGKPLDIAVTGTPQGLDIDIRGAGPLGEDDASALVSLAAEHDLARLSNHGRLVALRRKPQIAVGRAMVFPPPGAFLQATQAGEEAIAALVLDATKGAGRVADLFCGLGAFALRLAARALVQAYDSDAEAVAAMRQAARAATELRLVEAVARDLVRAPLSANELTPFDAVVFDPPRAGAQAQAREIAKSQVGAVVAVSCNAQSLARDAKTLIDGGYVLGAVTPIDQFRYSPHVEAVALFVRPGRAPRKKPLLSR